VERMMKAAQIVFTESPPGIGTESKIHDRALI